METEVFMPGCEVGEGLLVLSQLSTTLFREPFSVLNSPIVGSKPRIEIYESLFFGCIRHNGAILL